MAIHRSTRYFFLLISALVSKYRIALFAGLVVGVIGSIGFFRFWPAVSGYIIRPGYNIAVVGEFTPSTLPLSIQKKISRGLTDIAPDGSALPALATNWEVSEDGKEYIFMLDTGAMWHTGKALTPSDVNYNIRNVTFTPQDNGRLKVTLEEPFSPFLTLVAKPIFQRGLRGIGEYKVTGIKLNGTSVVDLKLSPAIDLMQPSLEYRFYKTEAQAVTAYKLGIVDTIEDLADPSALSDWRNTTIDPHVKNDRIVAIYFNLKNDSFFSDKAVRQALAYAVPDLGVPRVQSPISQGSWAYTDRIREYTYDIERAKRVLDSDESSPAAELVITTFSPYLETAQKIAQSWTDIGVKTTVKVENSVSSDYQVLISAQDIPPDPDQYPFWHQTQETNVTGYTNVKIDKLLEDGRKEIDPEVRKSIYTDFQRYLTEDAPAIFLYHPTLYTVQRSNQ